MRFCALQNSLYSDRHAAIHGNHLSGNIGRSVSGQKSHQLSHILRLSHPAGQVLPVIGVTLPFFSAGGSSVVMMYLCVGLVLSVGMHARASRLQARPIL